MRNLVLFTTTILVFFTSCQPTSQIPLIYEINKNWSFSAENQNNWYPAKVPGNIYSDLIDNKLIEDPFIGENEKKVQWVSDSTWLYTTSFKASPEILNKENITLNFEGLDTYASVLLNDHPLISTNNAFRTYNIPIKNWIKEKNTLKIRFDPTKIHEQKAKQQLDYTLPEGNRVFTRKAQFQYGWDWGPVLNTSGIWKKVYLKAWDHTSIDNVYLKKERYSEDQARFIAVVTLTSPPTKTIKIQVETDQKVFHLETSKGKSKHQFEIPVVIEHPTFWWPHNMGNPHLYDVKISLFNNNKLIDKTSLKHGIRNISLITDKDSIGQSFYFNVNGVAVYMKGANYIPQHSLQNKVFKKDYEELLEDVVNANMNMLRVWGGGIYEHDIFYDLCDEKGILVWQDFMFACAMYPGDKAYLNNVQKEAEDQLKRLRNHPSIVLWCGNNESSEGWHRWGWQEGKTVSQKEEIWKNYLRLFDSILPQTVKKHTQIPYWESSPKYGRGNPKYQFEGDAHDWWVWHDGYPFEHFEEHVPRFMSEFGFQSYPSPNMIAHINPSGEIKLNTKSIQSHQKHHRGFQLIDEYMKRDFPVPSSDEEYIYVSQLVQAHGMRKGIEAHRRAKPYNMGTLYWQLNDCWPGISWSSIDHFGNWKALHYHAKRAFEDVLISFKKEENTIKVYIVNDKLTPFDKTLTLKIIDFEGTVLWSQNKKINVPENSSVVVNTVMLSDLDLGLNSTFLDVQFGEHSAHYYFDRPKNLVLSSGNINFNITKQENQFTIKLTSEVLQKDVYLFTDVEGTFSDNFFDIKPNETITVIFSTVADEIGQIQYKSLNKISSN